MEEAPVANFTYIVSIIGIYKKKERKEKRKEGKKAGEKEGRKQKRRIWPMGNYVTTCICWTLITI